MGVIRDDLFGHRTEDNIEYTLEPAISSASASEDELEMRKSHRKAPRAKPRIRDLSICEAVAKRRTGAKSARRCENLRELITMIEREDMEMDFTLFEPSVSVFAELLSEKEKMQTWNDFVNASEEEQREILQHGRRLDTSVEEKVAHMSLQDNMDSSSGSDVEEGWVQVKDKRTAHPSFSAEDSFQKVDKNIRTMLKRRQRPMGMLVSLEQELIQFFQEWPSSVYVSRVSSSYERMMLHALCQYLNLISKSFDCSGVRQTQVENPNCTFLKPPVLLTQYLETSKAS